MIVVSEIRELLLIPAGNEPGAVPQALGPTHQRRVVRCSGGVDFIVRHTAQDADHIIENAVMR